VARKNPLYIGGNRDHITLGFVCLLTVLRKNLLNLLGVRLKALNEHSLESRRIRADLIMRPSSLGGGRILRRTLSVRLSVRPSRYRASRRAT